MCFAIPNIQKLKPSFFTKRFPYHKYRITITFITCLSNFPIFGPVYTSLAEARLVQYRRQKILKFWTHYLGYLFSLYKYINNAEHTFRRGKFLLPFPYPPLQQLSEYSHKILRMPIFNNTEGHLTLKLNHPFEDASKTSSPQIVRCDTHTDILLINIHIS